MKKALEKLRIFLCARLRKPPNYLRNNLQEKTGGTSTPPVPSFSSFLLRLSLLPANGS